jgi:hypothetical protein
MNFPPGYQGLRTYMMFAKLSGLSHPLENIFSLYADIQISGGDTVRFENDQDLMRLLFVTEDGVSGEQLKQALLQSGMFMPTNKPHVYYAQEFCELNKGLYSSRNNGRGGGANQHKKNTQKETNESNEEPTNRRTNRQTEEGNNEPTKELKDERMNGQVTNRLPTGNPPVTHGYDDFSEDPF